MKTHRIKTVQPHFDNVKNGWKNFEIRLNDRNYQQNDIVILEEYNPLTDEKTGAQIHATIGTVLESFPGLNFQYCIFSLLNVHEFCTCTNRGNCYLKMDEAYCSQCNKILY